MTRLDAFVRPLLGRRRDLTYGLSLRPGVTRYSFPVTRNGLRRGTLVVTLASFTNGGLDVQATYKGEPWEAEGQP